MVSDNFDSDTWLFYWVTQVASLYESKLEIKLKKQGLDIPSYRVLMLLGRRDGLRVTYLAEQSITKQSTMTRIIHRMRDKGLVTIRSGGEDARVSNVFMTKKGQIARKIGWKAAQSIMQAVENNVSKKNSEKLLRNLSEIHQTLRDI